MPVSDSGLASAQQGFSLPETLVAALLFAVSLAGLLQYHQVLQQLLQHQWQQRQAWRFAHQQLDVYGSAAGEEVRVTSLPSGWSMTLTEQVRTPACRSVTVTTVTPYRYRAVLTRWFCRIVAEDSLGVQTQTTP
ncbi:prepilin-type N-terminal cleavage/methylation domain-containing protein [Prodigiosinella aquatilis]|nr:prepilin-type N-terminal cleavage/methylation domain-containing protein [Prodigiosinella sp. LS101]WJV54949.1 prepilin-type N-terminal cleavage/methylation domain-containing protein [Prodigiosinella sp. LS101]WJV59310.1 prepilin-type N-terminal cleavage/methylation domain-containing protein [Pectobacteriaceae bacterium C111]